MGGEVREVIKGQIIYGFVDYVKYERVDMI